VTAATAANPMNRRAHTATPTSRLAEIVLGDLQVVGDGALDAEGAIRFLEGPASFGQLLEAVSDKIEQTKLRLSSRGDRRRGRPDIEGPGSAPKMCQCIPPAPKLST
jgi:hypothetical protein